MSSDLHSDVAIFAAALDLPEQERAGYLARACEGDIALRERVEALLQAHARLGDFMQETPGLAGGFPERTIGEAVGDRIGRYKLLQQIGEGGCGIVFMAEQEEPVRRRVALKVIKPGMDTRSVIARFEAERQALALMDHPSIAKVFDAGATESGRPYFVMELVRGTKITDYCDENALTTDERLDLFVSVCQAIQHAHQKGIIHRDIKPSNILVTQTAVGMPLPVVIDFGIAKATTNQQLTDKTLFTAFEMLIGTPAYMSPEQAALTNVDVDTRSDIYSLGVLLYELLTGTPPFDPRRLLQAGLDEVRRVIREEDPVRPSTKLTRLGGPELTTVARARRAEPPKLIRAVSGDLDWIVMKALEKDPCRRYETANGLLQDIRRFLGNETVSARPPSRLYRLKKLIRRNQLLFVCLAGALLLLVTSLIVATASLAKEHRARSEADAALAQAQKDKATAQTEAAKSQQITRFLQEMLQGVGPAVAVGRDTTMLREILDRTASRVGEGMTNQPGVEAELRRIVGRLCLELGSYDRAEAMHAAELVIRRRLWGAESLEAASTLNDLGNACWKQRKLADAENAYREALRIRRHLLGDAHADVATTLNSLGAVFRRQRKLAESESLTREGLDIRKRLYGDEHLEVADSLRNLSIILVDRGQREEAERIARDMVAMRRRLLGNEHHLVASALADLAWVIGSPGNMAEAEALETEAFGIQRKIMGDDHPDVARSIYLLGDRMRSRGSLTESRAVLLAALSIQRKLLGSDHPDVLATMQSVALVLEREKDWETAELVRRETVSLRTKLDGKESPRILNDVEALARTLLKQSKTDDALQMLDEALTASQIQKRSSIGLIELRLNILGSRAQWREAETNAALLLKLQPDESMRHLVLGTFLAHRRSYGEYRELCRDFLARFQSSSNVYVADQLAKTCLLVPNAELDSQAMDRLIDHALAHGKGDRSAMPFFQLCKALAQYRLGRFDEAVSWAGKSLSGSNRDSHAHASAVMAMAQWKLGDRVQAQAMLEQGNRMSRESSPTRLSNDASEAWLGWMLARISLDEAELMILTSTP